MEDGHSLREMGGNISPAGSCRWEREMEWVGYIDGVPKEGEETLTLGTLPTGEDVCTTIAKEVSNTTRYIPYSRYLQYHAKSLRDKFVWESA